MNREKLALGNLNLAYLEWKNQGLLEGKSQNILLLHGMADNCLVWQKLGEFLSTNNRNYHIIAPDLRGHGDSSKPKTGYFKDDYLEDLSKIYQHFNWQKAHIIAHSWSAKIACIWATQNPQLCQSLTLIDPFFINSMPSFFSLTFPILYKVLPFLKLMQLFPDYLSIEKTAKTLKQYQGWTPWQQEIFNYGIEQKKDGYWSSKFSQAARNEIFEDVMKEKGLTTKLDLPSLLVLPEKGLNRTSWQISPYKQYLTNLQIAKVKGNHWAFIVEPDEFNQTINQFLQSLQLEKGKI
ncbi:alpha/beta fold hydrolase [Cyanobacterium aponinum]|uniref:Alpha/beta fold hydrolase n=1 Tax=Cyanobacterium aponinum 0216 TaxID=2676140 RepID=A0A844GWH3_9CHRO|nr:alpha/beta hydrolase [Cyanobacterium aponinum]MTF39248.1 alpha/beta fold hydrolase [Cyanobacterium aponinum 0216]